MEEIRIERLALKLSGVSQSQGDHLARLITQGLAAAHIDRPGAGTPPSSGADAKDTGDLERLSNRIAAQIIRQIERSL
jgi:hypothetical protein